MNKLIALIFGIISVNIAFGLCREITVVNAGTLSEELGDDQLSVDTLIVNGPINTADFKTMWAASFYGNLSYIDIADADVENKTIPTRAFLDASAQTDENKGLIPIKLRKIVLPDDVGDNRFSGILQCCLSRRNQSATITQESWAYKFCQLQKLKCIAIDNSRWHDIYTRRLLSLVHIAEPSNPAPGNKT